MKNVMRKMDAWLMRGQMRVQNKVQELLDSEQGDTNFISIAIVLAIVIAVALVFMGLKDRIMGIAENAVKNLENNFKK